MQDRERAPPPPPNRVLGWLLSTDNVRVGVLWVGAALLFFYAGGLFAILLRAQLAFAGRSVMSDEAYAEAFTMHGTFMIFFFAVVAYFGVGSVVIPKLVGARQMAFHRLNTLDFWLILLGGLVLEVAYFVDQAPAAGWTSYAPLSLAEHSPGRGQDWWAWAVGIETLGGTLAGLNFLVTILHARRPGLPLRRLPLVAWGFLFASVLVVVAGPFLLAGLAFQYLDRNLGTLFLSGATAGGPLLWQDLFWFYSHPATYVMLVPGLGIVSVILMRFARRELLSRVGAIVAIGFITGLGFLVWWHHMFVAGIPHAARLFGAIATWSIVIPSGFLLLMWIASIQRGSLRLTTPMLFALGVVGTLAMGGADGLYMAYVPFDVYAHDTYWLVAHFHYIIFGGTVLGLFAAIYYWFPAALHRQLDERLGKWHFWGTIVGVNLTFFPMHLLGLAGMRRRVSDYAPELGGINLLQTGGMFLIAASSALFLVNVWLTLRHAPLLPSDVWEADAA